MKRSRLVLSALLTAVVVVAANLFVVKTPNPTAIASDDLLEIKLVGLNAPNSATTWSKRVNSGGQINLPLVGTIETKGLSLQELVKRINIVYFENKLVRNVRAKVAWIESGQNPSIRSGPVAEGDFVRVRIFDLVAPRVVTTMVKQIGDEGTIELPLVGRPKVEGMSEAQMENAITQWYRDANLIHSAMVECLRIAPEQARLAATQPWHE
jgi:protein involved in polysaccharide export with SLBB domain